MLYTRNFIHFMRGIDVYYLHFIDEAHMNRLNGQCYFGASESGSRCVDISVHQQGQNHTIFSLVGLNNKCLMSCVTAPTDGTEFLNFIPDACTAFNNEGQKIIEAGLCICSFWISADYTSSLFTRSGCLLLFHTKILTRFQCL